MKAVVLEEPGRALVRNRPDPTPRDEEVIVRVSACGVCGSDLHLIDGELPDVRYPLVPGHEFAGEVVEVGRDVTDIEIGQRVAVDPSLPCGRCVSCRRGRVSLCTDFGAIGGTVDGAFAQYTSVPTRNVFVLPDEMSDAEGALLEPLACVVHGMGRLGVTAGDHILIVGAGAIGLMLLELALRSCAARVVVVEVQAERRRAAEHRGVETYASVEEALGSEAGQFDRVVDATGVAVAIEDAFGAVGQGGTLLLFGVAPADAIVRLSPYRIYRREISVLGSMGVGYAFASAVSLMTSDRLELDGLVTHTVGLEEWSDGLAMVRSGAAIKCHVDPGR